MKKNIHSCDTKNTQETMNKQKRYAENKKNKKTPEKIKQCVKENKGK